MMLRGIDFVPYVTALPQHEGLVPQNTFNNKKGISFLEFQIAKTATQVAITTCEETVMGILGTSLKCRYGWVQYDIAQ